MEDTFVVNTLDSLQLIRLSEVMYCQAEKSYCKLFLASGKEVLVSQNMKNVCAQLGKYFIKISKSVVVHGRYIVKIDKKEKVVLLSNGMSLNYTAKFSDLELCIKDMIKKNKTINYN